MATVTIIQVSPPQPAPPQGATTTLAVSDELVNLNSALEAALAAQSASGTSGVVVQGTLAQ